jgi:hypothetical protein
VGLDGPLAHEQATADVAVGQPSADDGEDLALPRDPRPFGGDRGLRLAFLQDGEAIVLGAQLGRDLFLPPGGQPDRDRLRPRRRST